jgi:DNA invertase Pin-like site-specific DNA recombinase
MIRTLQFLPFVPLFENAACAQIEDKNLFFPDGKSEETDRLPILRKICKGCIERKECLEYAIKEEIPYGIWGGKTPSERGQNLPRDEKKKRNDKVIRLRNQGISTDEIASKVGLRVTQIYRIFTEANKARKREDQSNQITNTPSADLSSSLESQR